MVDTTTLLNNILGFVIVPNTKERLQSLTISIPREKKPSIKVYTDTDRRIIIEENERLSRKNWFNLQCRKKRKYKKYKCKRCHRIFRQKYNAKAHFFCRPIIE